MDPDEDDAFTDDGEGEWTAHSAPEPRETAAEEDYYALLNVSKSATEDQVRSSYRHLAILLHPDKHPAERRAAAASRFQAVNRAYGVLSDPSKRAVYDALGVLGLKDDLAPGQDVATPEEIRAQYHRLARGRDAEQVVRSLGTHGVVVCSIDATRLFEPRSADVEQLHFEDADPTTSDEEHEQEHSLDSLDDEGDLEVEFVEEEPPVISVSKLSVWQAVDTYITPSLRLNTAASATTNTHNGRGIGNILGTARWEYSQSVLVNFGINLIGRGVPYVEVIRPMPYLPGCQLNINASFPTIFLPPPIVLTVTRQLSPGWLGQVSWGTGTWSLPFWPPVPYQQIADNIDSVISLLDELTRRNAPNQRPESHGQTEEGPSLQDKRAMLMAAYYQSRTAVAALSAGLTKLQASFISFGLQSTDVPGLTSRLKRSLTVMMTSELNGVVLGSLGGAVSVAPIVKHLLRLVPQTEQLQGLEKDDGKEEEEEEHDQPINLSWNLRSSLSAIFGFKVTAGLEGRAGRIGWGVGLSFSNIGVTLRIRISRLGQRLALPILLARESDATLAICTAGVVGISVFGCVCAGEAIRLRRRSLELKALREARAEARVRKRREAEEVRDLLRDQARRSVAAEQAAHGLLIHEATYGRADVLAGQRVPTAGDTLDVRIPLQALITSGRLHIAGGHGKSGLLGFYDVCPGERKALRVEYEFGGQRYQVVVGDREELIAPSDAHATPSESASR